MYEHYNSVFPDEDIEKQKVTLNRTYQNMYEDYNSVFPDEDMDVIM
jgi:hypothetical protein